MLELLLDYIALLGADETKKILISVGESALKNYKDFHTWKKITI